MHDLQQNKTWIVMQIRIIILNDVILISGKRGSGVEMEEVRDFPKLESPFVRKMVDGIYAVTDEVAAGYEWCLGNEDIEVSEKLDGTDVSIIIENGEITEIWNRLNPVKFFDRTKKFIVESLLNSVEKGYLDGFIRKEGQYFGEVIGPKVNGNPYELDEHLWIPFGHYVREHLVYKSWYKYSHDFSSIRDWLLKPVEEGGVFSLIYRMRHHGKIKKPEGVVFLNTKTGRRAKLRLDMYAEYGGKRHKE